MIPYDISVKEKTGFRVINPMIPIIIYDERAVPFYDTSRLERPVYAFNLPVGNYTVVSGRFDSKREPENFDLYPMPAPMRDKGLDPTKFDIEWGECPYKCTIDWKKRKIIYDESLFFLPLPQLIYIFWHECGHRYYGVPHKEKPWPPEYAAKYQYAEACCDRYAANKMIEAGFNPSQIGEGIIGSLDNDMRKEILIDTLTEKNRASDTNYFDEGGWRYDESRNFCDSPGSDVNHLAYNDTPTTNWTCEDWVVWHKDLLRAYQDGRLATFTKEKALEETNRVFAYHWKESAGFSKTFWGKCGYESGFFNYFKDIGYTDHISFLSGLVTPLLSGATSVTSGAGEVLQGGGTLTGFIGKNLFFMLAAAVVLYVLARKYL